MENKRTIKIGGIGGGVVYSAFEIISNICDITSKLIAYRYIFLLVFLLWLTIVYWEKILIRYSIQNTPPSSIRIFYYWFKRKNNKEITDIKERITAQRDKYLKEISKNIKEYTLNSNNTLKIIENILQEDVEIIKRLTNHEFALNIKLLEKHTNTNTNNDTYIGRTFKRIIPNREKSRCLRRCNTEKFIIKQHDIKNEEFSKFLFEQVADYINRQKNITEKFSAEITSTYIEVYLTKIKYYYKRESPTIYNSILGFIKSGKGLMKYKSLSHQFLYNQIESYVNKADLLRNNIDCAILCDKIYDYILKDNDFLNLEILFKEIEAFENKYKTNQKPNKTFNKSPISEEEILIRLKKEKDPQGIPDKDKNNEKEVYQRILDKIDDYKASQYEFYSKLKAIDIAYKINKYIEEGSVLYRSNLAYDYVISTEESWLSNDLEKDKQNALFECSNIKYLEFYNSLGVFMIKPIQNAVSNESIGLLIIDSIKKNIFIREELDSYVGQMCDSLFAILNIIIKNDITYEK